MKYFILGSCVTRDIFRVVDKENEVLDYYARTKIKSLISRTVEIKDISLQSNFQRKIVKRDFNKTFFKDIKEKKFDYLIIDLIDERFDIVEIEDSFVTRSNEFINAGLDSIATRILYPIEEWKKDCEKFSERILNIISADKIFIHEVYWAREYIDENIIKEYANQKNIEINNLMLKEYYRILKECLPKAHVISSNNIIGSANHLWGLSPVHYIDDYYKSIYNEIQMCIPKMKKLYEIIKSILKL